MLAVYTIDIRVQGLETSARPETLRRWWIHEARMVSSALDYFLRAWSIKFSWQSLYVLQVLGKLLL